MTIYQSKYMTLAWLPEQAVLEVIWTPATNQMSIDDYQTEMLAYAKAVQHLNADKVLSDTRQMDFPILPDVQIWVTETIVPQVLAAGLRSIALTVSEHIITQVSIEMALEEVANNGIDTKYFHDKETAMTWLLTRTHQPVSPDNKLSA